MLKKDFVKEVQGKIEGITIKETTELVDVVLDTLKDCLLEGEEVKLSGFGTFKTVEREARKGRNPKTGEEIDIPATKAPKFSFANTFKANFKG